VTTIEESKDLEEIKIEELMESFQTYDLSLPQVKKVKTTGLKASKKKKKVSSEEDSEKEEDAVAMLAKNFRRLMKKDPRGPRCFECLGFGHIRANCGNLKQGKGKAYNVTLSDESEEEESLAPDQFLAFVAPHKE